MGWKIDEERQIAPGHYAKLLAEIQGWETWRFENVGGRSLLLVKAAVAKRLQSPLSAYTFSGEMPYIAIEPATNPRAYLRGSLLTVSSTEWRVAGERFMQPWVQGFDPLALDGKRIEAVIKLKVFRRPRYTIETESGYFNLSGLKEAVQAANELTERPNSK